MPAPTAPVATAPDTVRTPNKTTPSKRRSTKATSTTASPAASAQKPSRRQANLADAALCHNAALVNNSYVNSVDHQRSNGGSAAAPVSRRRTMDTMRVGVSGYANGNLRKSAVVSRPDYTRPKPTQAQSHGPAAMSGVPPPPATAVEALHTVEQPSATAAVSSFPFAPAAAANGGAASHMSAAYSFRTTEQQKATYAALSAYLATPLPELQEPKAVKTYEETSLEESLYKLIETHDIIAVAGAFFGDEGKGKTVDAVAHHPKCTAIARTNSGENAGHTVFDKHGRKFVFNLAPSGLLTPGKKNYIGPECVLDPISFMEKEVKQLIDAGIEYHDTLFLGNCCIVTPYHKLLDLLGSAVNASTLKGMAPVHASKVTKRGIRLDHLYNDEATLRSRLAQDMNTYFGLLKVKGLSDADVVQRCREENSDGVIRVPAYVVDFAQAEDKVSFLVDLYRTRVRENAAFPTRCDVIHELRAALVRGEKVLLEGPQSYWLSNAREKFWGSTTSADTTAAGLLATAQLNFQQFRTVVINVHKAPASSRVGLGACPCGYVPQDFFSAQNIKTLHDLPAGMCTDFDAIQKRYFAEAFKHADDADRFTGLVEPIEYTDSTGTYNIGVAMAIASALHHGECGAVTKKPRVTGLFDCVLQQEVSAVQGPYLTISALDRADDYDKVGITIAYLYYSPDGAEIDVNGKTYKNGDIIRAGDPVPGEQALYYCHPITKLVKGWKDSPIAAKTRRPGDALPQGLCAFLSTVEHFGNCKVLSIGNGPNGEDIIYLKQ